MKKTKIVLMLLIILTAGCASTSKQLLPTNNKGGYSIKYNRSKDKLDFLYISGKVLDVKTSKPLSDVRLLLGCYKTITSDNGEFLFKISTIHNVIPTFIETNFIGYKSIMTDIINTTNTNRIQIDFYLEEDSRPLGDCLGTINLKQID
jgi:hypothetical protein